MCSGLLRRFGPCQAKILTGWPSRGADGLVNGEGLR